MIQEQAQQGSNWEYLCSLLRTLLAVPYDSLVGRGMWRLIVSTANRVVTTSQKENVEFLSNQDILDLIGRKQLLDEKFNAIHDEDTSQDAMRQRIRQLEDELLDLKRVTRFASSTPEYTARLISDILSQVSDVMEVKFARDDPVYSKYFTLLESGARMEDVLALCRKEGNDEKVVRGPAVTLSVKPEFVKRIQADALKNAPPGTVTAAAGTSTAAGTAPVEDPNDPRKKPEFAKWFKLQQMGIPREHLVLKMEAEGVDPSILDYGGPAATPAAPAEEVVRPRKKEEKKAAKEEKPVEEAPKKPAKNPLELLPPTTLDLDNWKRVYSNTHSDFYSVMDKFWAMYDAAGWSLWFCDYMYNDENKKGFMTANLVSGFIQRCDELRKYAFGNMSILKGENDAFFTIKGAWLMRGDSIQPMLDSNPDSASYTWKKVDINNEADKKELADLWCASETIDGKEINSNEVFK